MSSELIISLVAVGALIIAGLAFYAGKLLFLVRKQQLKEDAFLATYNEKKQKVTEHTLYSIRTIAKAVAEEQCEVAEGTIRLCTLLDSFGGENNAYQTQYPKLYELFSKIKHFPTHQSFKEQEKQVRMKQNMQRWQLEASYKDDIKSESVLLQNFQLNLN